jgi:hypothetical protein
MNGVKLSIFTAISIATAFVFTSCAGNPAQMMQNLQPGQQKDEKSAGVIQQEQQQRSELESVST